MSIPVHQLIVDRCYGTLRQKLRSGPSWCIGLAAVYCVLALVGCAPTTIAERSTPSRPATTISRSATLGSHRPATTVSRTATRVTHTRTASERQIPLLDRSLLKPQPEPDCTFTGPLSNPITAEDMRMKLDYEQQCYRQSESITRTRLQQLQKSIEEIPGPDRSWREPQATPDCAFKGPLSNPITAEETRVKLDYEQRCYRQAESNTRTRLQQLQNSISEARKPSIRRKGKGKRHRYVRHHGSGNHSASGHLPHSTYRTI
jgi:hypothetical protein